MKTGYEIQLLLYKYLKKHNPTINIKHLTVIPTTTPTTRLL